MVPHKTTNCNRFPVVASLLKSHQVETLRPQGSSQINRGRLALNRACPILQVWRLQALFLGIPLWYSPLRAGSQQVFAIPEGVKPFGVIHGEFSGFGLGLLHGFAQKSPRGFLYHHRRVWGNFFNRGLMAHILKGVKVFPHWGTQRGYSLMSERI